MNSKYTFLHFTLLTFAIALPFFACIYFLPHLQDPQSISALPFWLGMIWSPTLSALLLFIIHKESKQLWFLLKSPGHWQAYALTTGVSLVALAVWIWIEYFAYTGRYTELNPSSEPLPWGQLILLLPVLHLIMGPLGEEIGWRGLALPTLLKRGWHPVTAALLVGLVWAVWHFPLWLLAKAPQAEIPIYIFSSHVLCYSMIFTAVFLLSKGSVWPSVCLHLILNYSSDLVCLTTGISNADYFKLSLPGFGLLALLCSFFLRHATQLSTVK